MPKGVPNKRYTAEFKKHVVETMLREGLSYKETERRFVQELFFYSAASAFSRGRCRHEKLQS